MNHWVIAAQKIFFSALIIAILFLSFLPTLGWAWHRVLPEHDHWFIGAVHQDFHAEPAALAPTDCVECTTTANGETIMHVPSFGALQIIAIAIGLPSGFSTSIPDLFIGNVIYPSLNFSNLFLPLLDPPPKSV